MNESDNTESPRSRWFTRISIALAAIAALVVLVTIGSIVTVYVVTERYESLHEAVKKGDTFAVRCFLLRGADVNVKEHDCTVLHAAAALGQKEVAELLIDKGADVDAKNQNCETPLHLAAMYCKTELAELLIEKGADVNAKDGAGCTPLDYTIGRGGHKDTADLLRKHGAKE